MKMENNGMIPAQLEWAIKLIEFMVVLTVASFLWVVHKKTKEKNDVLSEELVQRKKNESKT